MKLVADAQVTKTLYQLHFAIHNDKSMYISTINKIEAKKATYKFETTTLYKI